MERWKSRSVLRRIYTTFILSTALQNFGTRPIVLGTARLIYTTKYVRGFSMLISGTELLSLWVPALIWHRFTCDFKRASGMSGALSQAVQEKKKHIADSRVQKAIVWLVALKKWKRLSQLWDETRSSLAPLRTWIKAATIRPAASYSGLYNTRRSQSNVR